MNSDLMFAIYIMLCGVILMTVEKSLKRTLGPLRTWGLGALLLFIIVLMFLWQGEPFSPDAPLGPWLPFVFYPITFLAVFICSDYIRYYVPRILRKGRT